MKGPVHQLNLESHRIPSVGVGPGRNHQRQVPLNCFVFARWRDIPYPLMQHQSVIYPQQWILRILPLLAFFVLIINQQIVLRGLTRPKGIHRIGLIQSNIPIGILKSQGHLHKTIIPKSAVEDVNPFMKQLGRRRNCIFATLTGAQKPKQTHHEKA